MRVPAVGPEEEQPVEQRLDVGDVGFPFWKDPEDAAVLLSVPVLVEVVDAGDAASVGVRVVHVFDVTGPVSRVTRHHGLRPLPDRLVPQPAGAHGDQFIDQVEQEADRLAAALRPAHPGDLVPADAPPADARDGAGQPAVLQRSGPVHLLHLVQHGVPGQLPEKTVYMAETVRQQRRDDPLQRQTLQIRVRYVLDKRHLNV